MTSLSRIAFACIVLAAAAAGCDQDAGEPCQTDRDCASGLECNRAPGGDRGECIDPDDEPDAGLGGTGGTGGTSGTGDAGGTGGGDDDAGAGDADGG